MTNTPLPDAPALTSAASPERLDRYGVSVDEYARFRRDGFLIVRGLVSPEEVAELRQHTLDLMQGSLPEQTQEMAARDTGSDMAVSIQGLEAPPAHFTPEEKVQYFLRIHMLHRRLALHERFLLHPRVLDVLEALIGPDILALQSMLFLKPPGKPGQGWHQDSYYIPTHPDTLCGAWVAVDDVDEMNGAMWMAKSSQAQPVYPPREGYGFGQTELSNIQSVVGVSDPDDEKNDLSQVAGEYDQILAAMRAGDVVFFGGHILHRSKRNFSADRMRRAFVGHYCNARSFTQWGTDEGNPSGVEASTGMTNGSHILARGDTHLPFAQPRFGTLCAALLPAEDRKHQSMYAAMMMADMESGMMGAMPTDPNAEHDHASEIEDRQSED